MPAPPRPLNAPLPAGVKLPMTELQAPQKLPAQPGVTPPATSSDDEFVYSQGVIDVPVGAIGKETPLSKLQHPHRACDVFIRVYPINTGAIGSGQPSTILFKLYAVTGSGQIRTLVETAIFDIVAMIIAQVAGNPFELSFHAMSADIQAESYELTAQSRFGGQVQNGNVALAATMIGSNAPRAREYELAHTYRRIDTAINTGHPVIAENLDVGRAKILSFNGNTSNAAKQADNTIPALYFQVFDNPNVPVNGNIPVDELLIPSGSQTFSLDYDRFPLDVWGGVSWALSTTSSILTLPVAGTEFANVTTTYKLWGVA